MKTARIEGKKAMCLSAPYKIDFLTRLQSTNEEYRTEREKKKKKQRRKAQWDYHTKIDSQPKRRRKQMRVQWVLSEFSDSAVTFDHRFWWFVFHVHRIYVTLCGTNCTLKLNHLLCTVDQCVCVCVWTSIQKQASAHARTHMNMCEHYYLFSLFQKPKIVVSISFIFLGMHKNAHVLPIILTLYSLVLLLLFWPKVWVVLRLRFSCPWLCNKIWMFFSCCHAFIPNFMYSDFFFVMTSKYSVLFFHVFRSCSVSVVVFFSHVQTFRSRRTIHRRSLIVVMIWPHKQFDRVAIACCFPFDRFHHYRWIPLFRCLCFFVVVLLPLLNDSKWLGKIFDDRRQL